MDEVDFVNGADVQFEKSKIMKSYRAIKRRMESRFLRDGGDLAAKLFLVSSKKSEQDFLESYIQTVKDNPSVLVIDEPQWNVKPSNIYSGKKFLVAVGNKILRSRVLTDEDDRVAMANQGYKIIEVPIEFKSAFDLDVDTSLMDYAGISSSLTTKFLVYDRIKEAFGPRTNPFTTPVLTIGCHDSQSLSDYFNPKLVNLVLRSKPCFLHIDGSLTGDRTGISMVAITGMRKVDRFDNDVGEAVSVHEMQFAHIFTVFIQCPSGDEISLEKNRQFIYYLKESGFNICGITQDGFQSRDNIQILQNAGYPAKLLSVDRTPDAYMCLKSAINEKRVSLLNIHELVLEMVNVERNNMTGKIDHTYDGKGSKDGLDSLAAALFNASQYDCSDQIYLSDDAYNVMDANVDDKPTTDASAANALLDDPSTHTDNKPELTDEAIEAELNAAMDENQIDTSVVDIRNKIDPKDQWRVTDDEISDLLYNDDDDFLIF